MISGLTGYAKVKNIFVHAVPVLSKYLELSDDQDLKCRLRFFGDQKCLSKSGRDITKNMVRFDDPVYYLGHIPGSLTTPQYFGLKDAIGDFWGEMVGYSGEPPMFTPAR